MQAFPPPQDPALVKRIDSLEAPAAVMPCPHPVGECADGDPPAPPGSPCPPGMEEVVKPQFTEAQVTKTVEAYARGLPEGQGRPSQAG